ncbi:hypothetical protein DM02DRAFT_650244 [Periconia macrospinosa]|uniref:ubiquitinyl hydrolase 1 n=1 Tax=Periconia macrospinosa TaxID=97972 RepID=A0A2V1E6H3_9PLEO|nr:hypothetical protein DM02DRAFT_650244 [Periconia macrospinosa]
MDPTIKFLIHHLCLPAKLPRKDDSGPMQEHAMLDTTIAALDIFKNSINDNPEIIDQISSISASIANLKNSRDGQGNICETQLSSLFRQLIESDQPQAIPLEVKAQNAGVIVSKRNLNLVFEVFELSPMNEAILSTEGRLIRTFPTHACEIPVQGFLRNGLAKTLSNALAKMSIEKAAEPRPQTTQGGTSNPEDSNTAHPGLVDQFLISFLSAIGSGAQVSTVTKHTRDEVIWSSNSFAPWRRSPLWLLVRLTLQLGLLRTGSDSTKSFYLYKISIVYLLTNLLDMAQDSLDMSEADLVHNLSAKVAHRLGKLKYLKNDPIYINCSKFAQKILTKSFGQMEQLWKCKMRDSDTSLDLETVSRLQPRDDLDIDILDLEEFIEQIPGRSRRFRNAKFEPTAPFTSYKANTIPKKFDAEPEYIFFQLAEVEYWVENYLPIWTENHAKTDKEAYRKLQNLATSYFKAASEVYSDPVSYSIMYLTTMELWKAIDTCARTKSSLLNKYDCEIDVKPLEALSLRSRAQVQRLAALEEYIKNRRNNVVPDYPSAFQSFGHENSFAVQYFNSSKHHQKLKVEIEKHAEEERDAKRLALDRKNKRYEELMLEADGLDCRCDSIANKGGALEHSSSCQKHEIKRKAASLRVGVHEWPLSRDDNKAKAMVFELQTPEFFARWRDMTMFIKTNVMGFTGGIDSKIQDEHFLKAHKGLKKFHSIPEDQRIEVAATSKLKQRCYLTFNSNVGFLAEDRVFVDNEIEYGYYDTLKSVFTTKLKPSGLIQTRCSYRLPDRSTPLQKYLNTGDIGGKLTENAVTTTLSDCPLHMTLNEYKAFANLGLGYEIRYLNILREISMPSIDLTQPEAQSLFLHTVFQVGPPSNDGTDGRASHWPLHDVTFLCVLITRIRAVLGRVENNWESWRVLAIFIQIALRALEFAVSDKEILNLYLEFLQDARKLAFDWLDDLEDKLQKVVNQLEQTALLSRATEVALVCISTFDVDRAFLPLVLPSDAKIYFRCSIVVHRSQKNTIPDDQFLYDLMLQCWRRVLFRVFTTLRSKPLDEEFQDGLNEAIQTFWDEFKPNGAWSELEEPHHHWLKVESEYSQSDPVEIHYNLLTAEVLVNDSPLARLPKEYTDHPVFSSLCRMMPIQATLSEEPGMKYCIQNPGNEMSIHFLKLKDNPDLLVAVVQNDSKFDLVPARVFEGILPTAFVDNYYHWYDHENQRITLRPKTAPWPFDEDSWLLRKVGFAWRLVKSHILLVNPVAATGKVVSAILGRLEHPSHIHILLDEETSNIAIELPRMHLDFSFTSGHSTIRCKQYSGMVIDPDQQTGTLIGLENKLALKHSTRSNDRVLLITEGLIAPRRDSNNSLRVSVTPDATSKIHAYRIDTILGRLIDSGNLHSKLFLSLLHAVTSHCLPDPLTAHTGTESALSILRSAAVFSFDVLSKQDAKTLRLIANLTPKRSYHSSEQKAMQNVQWDETLPYMSQHHDFLLIAENILDEARRRKVFWKDIFVEPGRPSHVNHDLLQRDRVRTSIFRIDGFGAEHYTQQKDKAYEGRVRIAPERAARSFIASRLIIRESFALHCGTSAESLQQTLREKHFTLDAGEDCTATTFEPHMIGFTVELFNRPISILPKSWPGIHRCLTEHRDSYSRSDIMIWLSALAFSDSADLHVIQTLAALYRLPEMDAIKPPRLNSTRHLYEKPTIEKVSEIVRKGKRALEDCGDHELPGNEPRKKIGGQPLTGTRKKKKFEKNQEEAVTLFADALFKQHRRTKTTDPVTPNIPHGAAYINIDPTMKKVTGLFTSWKENQSFYKHICELCAILEQQRVDAVQIPVTEHIVALEQSQMLHIPRGYKTQHIFQLDIPQTLAMLPSPRLPTMTLGQDNYTGQNQSTRHRLQQLCDFLETRAKTTLEKLYVADMRDSLQSLQDLETSPLVFKEEVMEDSEDISMEDSPENASMEIPSTDVEMQDTSQVLMQGCSEHFILKYSSDVEEYYCRLFTELEQLVRSDDCHADLASQLPRIYSPMFWLRQLQRKNFTKLSEQWKAIIVKIGLALVERSRASRLVTILRTGQSQETLQEELQNVGHRNWDPKQFPEKLLLEAESGIVIREVQEDISKKMSYPPEGQNAVMQLNMGEGKSSVIIPMIASELSDGNALVRVIVGKAQCPQMRQMLIAKLGGLLDRPIYHMPFSRSLKLSKTEADIIYELCNRCRITGGIILLQPEHALSFKLMLLESLTSRKTEVGLSLLKTQKELFGPFGRDIVDECDEPLGVKSEVAFTDGQQKTIEMGAERWCLITNTLSLAFDCSLEVKKKLPLSMEVHEVKGKISRIRILRDDAEKMFLDRLAKAICEKGLPGIAIHKQSRPLQQAIEEYIRYPKLTDDQIKAVEKSTFWSHRTSSALHIIRGLIAGGVLPFTLRSKRWRVHYGSDPNHQPVTHLAVPYRSKDHPSPRSEYSHPDVAIILTSLHYYYAGLNDEDLLNAFTHLFKSDDPDSEYKTWIWYADSLRQAHQSLSGINLKDRWECIHEIFPKFRYAKPTIDYFLCNVVFAKDMKEFSKKLAASGWDLGAFKAYQTTGFSGTADAKYILPLNMNFLDLQKHTNALVLTHILRSENTVELISTLPDNAKHASAAIHLLNVVNDMMQETRVIIDVGAQILELGNNEVAEAWLKINHEAKAVVYFEDQQLVVRDRRGRIEPLQTSAFSTERGDCLVYLDEAHTRGTDLKLPQTYRAAVFLGANLTKDATVQACMRLRQLGRVQSLVFCLNNEIETAVRQLTLKKKHEKIEVCDVLAWVMSESTVSLRRVMPLWANQGFRFEWQNRLWQELMTSPTLSKEDAERFQEHDTTSIENRYGPRTGDRSINSVNHSGNPDLAQIIQRCQDFQASSLGSVDFEEEQERELNPEAEVEEERHIEKPQDMEYATHQLSPDIARLVEKSEIRSGSKDLIPAFKALGWKNVPEQFPTSLLVTKDFIRSVKGSLDKGLSSSDSYLKPKSTTTRRLVIISAFEADMLLPKIRESKTALLHLYAPHTNIGFTSIDSLDLYCIGESSESFSLKHIDPSDTLQLNLFAGQLYFKSYNDYTTSCMYLGLAASSGQARQAEPDGFVKGKENKWFLKDSPIEFLVQLMNMRREGEGLGRTHLAKMLRGVVLDRKDFPSRQT